MNSKPDPSDDRRVIVVGSGPAGAMAAYMLVRAGIPTLMLESGLELPKGILVRLKGRNLIRRRQPLGVDPSVAATKDPRTRFFAHYGPGGMTNQWTGAVPRFCPQDFTEGQRLHAKYVWPITYQELAPYYEIAERQLRITASPIDVPCLPAGYCEFQLSLPKDWARLKKPAARFGQGFAPMPLADGPRHLLTRRATAWNSYSWLVEKLLGNPNFQLIRGAHALRIECDGSSRKAVSVIYRDRKSGLDERLSATAFVLGCGAVNSAKLLLSSSSSDFPAGLGNSAGLLGRYLHDHPREWWVFDLERPVSLLSPPGYLTRRAHYTSSPLMATSWTVGVVGTVDTIRSRFGLRGTAVGVQLLGTMIPHAEHCVALAPDRKDEFGWPAVDIAISFDRKVIDHVAGARQHFIDLMNEAGLHGMVRSIAPQLYPGSAKHYGGTARMHASPMYGVTDRFNRLHDVKNILVVDAGCFTTAAEKNPTLTIMALAARAAAQLAKRLRGGQEIEAAA